MIEKFRYIIDYDIISFQNFSLDLGGILTLIIIGVVARMIAWTIRKVIFAAFLRRNHDQGNAVAISQLAKYFIYVWATIIAIESLGINLTILIASSAALFVGIGLGLQQIFNDIVSGIFLLFERNVEVGDVVEIDGLVGRVLNINIRTSTLHTRDHITIIVPNSKLLSDNVINWTKGNPNTRFNVKVGVAYGSDTRLVENILLEVANIHSKVSKKPLPIVKFVDFGNSSLDFELIFFTKDTWLVEVTKSDLRFEIDRRFRESGVTIPFPQRDLHIKTGQLGQSSSS